MGDSFLRTCVRTGTLSIGIMAQTCQATVLRDESVTLAVPVALTTLRAPDRYGELNEQEHQEHGICISFWPVYRPMRAGTA